MEAIDLKRWAWKIGRDKQRKTRRYDWEVLSTLAAFYMNHAEGVNEADAVFPREEKTAGGLSVNMGADAASARVSEPPPPVPSHTTQAGGGPVVDQATEIFNRASDIADGLTLPQVKALRRIIAVGAEHNVTWPMVKRLRDHGLTDDAGDLASSLGVAVAAVLKARGE